jgi:hypothetical protein
MKKSYRLFRARWFPLSFARWLERSERCPVTITNSADCVWQVTIGAMPPCEGHSIGIAMQRAALACYADPKWIWMDDFLRTWLP